MAENIREILRTYTSKLEDSNKFAKPSDISNAISQASTQIAQTYATITGVEADLNTKQDTLISGVNIKTIHNQSILGAGNIEIVGPIGPTGDKGDPGNPGPTGAIGPTGLQGAVGPTGADGKDGTSVSILGSYNTLSDLQAAHPTGNSGDAYLVGTDLYIWSSTTNDWVDVGRIQGLQGDQGPKGDTGDTGPIGPTGSIGPTGAKGEKGDQGPRGNTGDTGAKGPTGDKGDPGNPGPTGAIGPTGPTGTIITANPTLIGSEITLNSIEIGSTKYKIEGITVAANPVITTSTITGITIDTTNYKIIIDDGVIQ